MKVNRSVKDAESTMVKIGEEFVRTKVQCIPDSCQL